MKIVMLTGSYLDVSRGGVESHIYYLSRSLIRDGHDVEVIRVGPWKGMHAVPDDVPFRWVATGRSGGELRGSIGAQFLYRVGTNFRRNRFLARSIANEVDEVDVVHHHDLIENYRTSRALANQLDATSFWTNHLGEFLVLKRTAVGRLVLRLLVRAFDGAIAPSEELASAPWIRDRMYYCPNGVDTSSFVPVTEEQRRKIRRELGWPDDRRVLLIPRRWAPTKGILEAAEALTRTKSRNIHVQFIGDRKAYGQYATRVDRVLGTIPYSFDHLGAVDPRSMVKYYQAADVTVIPSLLEATSLSALEAMACGCQVVSTDTGGMPEIVRHGVTGWLCRSGDPASLADALDFALDLDAKSSRQMSNAARDFVASNFGWNVIAARTVEQYRRAIERHLS